MNPLSLIDKNLLSTSTARVVKRVDYEQLVAAHEVLAAAHALSATQEAELETLRQAATQAGYTAGVEQGQAAWAQQRMAQHHAQQTELHALQPVLVDVVMQSLKHLVGELPAQIRFESLAQQVVRSVVRARHLRLVVAAVDVAAARSLLARWQIEHPDVLAIDVMADDALSPGDCVLETEEGAVDGRLSQRLASIETALASHLASVLPDQAPAVQVSTS